MKALLVDTMLSCYSPNVPLHKSYSSLGYFLSTPWTFRSHRAFGGYFYWFGMCFLLHCPHSSQLGWNLTLRSLSLKSELKRSLFSLLRELCLFHSWSKHLAHSSCVIIRTTAAHHLQEKVCLLKDCPQTILVPAMDLTQHPECSRVSINVSCVVKRGNSGSTTATFISKKGLFPKEEGSIFAHSSFWKDFSDRLLPF